MDLTSTRRVCNFFFFFFFTTLHHVHARTLRVKLATNIILGSDEKKNGKKIDDDETERQRGTGGEREREMCAASLAILVLEDAGTCFAV